MKTMPALAATAVALLALTGCATANATTTASTPTVATSTSAVDSSNIYRAVHAGWKGDDAPSKPWIDDAATLVCKQILGGIEPRVVAGDNRLAEGNNLVVVLAAQKFVC